MTDALTNEKLSVEIARRLFPEHGGQFGLYPEPYASDHNAAMGLVVPEMRKRGYELDMSDDLDCGTTIVTFQKREGAHRPRSIAECKFGEEPRAICLAALAALDAEEGQG